MGLKDKGEFYNREYFEGIIKPPISRCPEEEIYSYMRGIVGFLTHKYKPRKVLDIGCAKGFLVKTFLESGEIEAYGVDISRYAVGAASPELRPRLKILDVETEKLPFPDLSFDLVTALDLIEHLNSPQRLLQEIYRVLRPEGIAFIITPSPTSPNAKIDPSHLNVHSRSYWKKIFKDNGFSSKLISPVRLEEKTELRDKTLGFIIKTIFYKIRHRIHVILTWGRRNYIFILTKF